MPRPAPIPKLRELIARTLKSTVLIKIRLVDAQNNEKFNHAAGVAIASDTVLTCAHSWTELKGSFKPAQNEPVRVWLDSDYGDDPDGSAAQHSSVGDVKRDDSRDLAILHVPDLGATKIVRGVDNELAMGDDVFFIGHPLDYRPLVSTAIASGKLVTSAGSHILILDGNINLGNSGGPLLSRETGKLLGIIIRKSGDRSDNGLAGIRDPWFGSEAGREVVTSIAGLNDNVQIGLGMAVRMQDVEAFLSAQGFVDH